MIEFTAAQFLPFVGDLFQLETEDGQELSLELIDARTIEAEDVDGPGKGGACCLTFLGPHTPELRQRMYQLSHLDLGDIDMIFLIPRGVDESGRTYEAVFS